MAREIITASKYERFIVVNESVHLNAISQARADYWSIFLREPNILRLHPNEHKRLLKIGRNMDPSITYKTAFGMTIEKDPTLPEGTWRVGESQETLASQEASNE